MTEDVSKVFGEGGEITFQGKAYEFAPFGVKMIGQFYTWLKESAWNEVERARGSISMASYQDRLDATAKLINSGALAHGTQAFANAFSSAEGRVQTLYLMLRKKNPQIERSLVEEMFDDDFTRLLLEAKMKEIESDPNSRVAKEATASPSPAATPSSSTEECQSMT